ncbi:MAG: hypothetical protein ACR2I5_02960 [Candidatus Limnocylindria bacterium]
MMMPSPVVLDRLLQERQRQLRMSPRRSHAPATGSLRVRIGHVLIAAGATLSGERVERPARPSTLPKTA